jgi:hypothetical protein
LPMPLPPPVTSATLPFEFILNLPLMADD